MAQWRWSGAVAMARMGRRPRHSMPSTATVIPSDNDPRASSPTGTDSASLNLPLFAPNRLILRLPVAPPARSFLSARRVFGECTVYGID